MNEFLIYRNYIPKTRIDMFRHSRYVLKCSLWFCIKAFIQKGKWIQFGGDW